MEKKQMIKKMIYLLMLCVLMAGCKHSHRRYQVMDHVSFSKIKDGSCFNLVTKKYGPPYDVMLLTDGIKEYRYVKLMAVAPGVTEQTHFVITVSYDGRIINTKAEKVMATRELYNPGSPDYFEVPPDCLEPTFCGEREIEGWEMQDEFCGEREIEGMMFSPECEMQPEFFRQ